MAALGVRLIKWGALHRMQCNKKQHTLLAAEPADLWRCGESAFVSQLKTSIFMCYFSLQHNKYGRKQLLNT